MHLLLVSFSCVVKKCQIVWYCRTFPSFLRLVNVISDVWVTVWIKQSKQTQRQNECACSADFSVDTAVKWVRMLNGFGALLFQRGWISSGNEQNIVLHSLSVAVPSLRKVKQRTGFTLGGRVRLHVGYVLHFLDWCWRDPRRNLMDFVLMEKLKGKEYSLSYSSSKFDLNLSRQLVTCSRSIQQFYLQKTFHNRYCLQALNFRSFPK